MINKMFNQFSRRKFLGAAGATTLLSSVPGFGAYASSLNNSSSDGVPASSGKERIVDMHVHFDPKKPNYIEDFLKVSERLNLTALMLTPFENRKVVAEAAKQHPTKIIPFGYVDLDAPDVVQQVEELHSMGFRGLGELEFVKKPYIDPSYFPVYERANEYGWVVLFHTGIVLRAKFNEPEDVASGTASAGARSRAEDGDGAAAATASGCASCHPMTSVIPSVQPVGRMGSEKRAA